MNRLSAHFTLEELTSTAQAVDANGDGIATVAEFLEQNLKEAEGFRPSLKRVAVELLEPIRQGLGKPITINSGFRGFTLNKLVGGAVTSQHCKGEAADFNVEGYEDRAGQIAVIRWVIESGIPFGQLLLERGCIHISLGDKREVAEYNVKAKTKIPIPELA
jgi:zinc D-Ala-D-Ala carboxypeptidase